MRVLQMYQKMSSYVNVRADLRSIRANYKSNKDVSDEVKTKFGIKMLLPLSSYAIGVAFSGIFFFYEANTFEQFSENLYVFSAIIFNLFGFIFHVTFVGAKIFGLIDKFEIIIEKRLSNPASKAIYEHANSVIESWTTLIHFCMIKITVPCAILPYIILCYFLYFVMGLKEDSFHLPFLSWFPFDWRNPTGYLFAFGLQLPFIYYCALSALCDLTFAVAACWLIVTFTVDINAGINDINQLNDDAKFTDKLCKLIEFHSIAQKAVSNLTDAFESIYILYFGWITFAICDLFLMLHIEISHGLSIVDIDKLILPVFLLSWITFIMFVLCESGDQVSSRFDEIDLYEECEWYTFPSKIQQFLPIVIINMRKSVAIQSFGNIPCARETFKKMINSAFSYYLILRTFLK